MEYAAGTEVYFVTSILKPPPTAEEGTIISKMPKGYLIRRTGDNPYPLYAVPEPRIFPKDQAGKLRAQQMVLQWYYDFAGKRIEIADRALAKAFEALELISDEAEHFENMELVERNESDGTGESESGGNT